MPRLKDEKIVDLAGELWKRGDSAWDSGHLDAAERLLRSAADRGDAIAMDSLATLLCELSRTDEAVGWYERAVSGGNGNSAWNLAMHYIPLGDQGRYSHWIKKAAAMGQEDALVEAAKLAENPEYMTRLPLEGDD